MDQSRLVSPRLIWGAATLMGVFSGFQAFQLVALSPEAKTPFSHLLLLNLSYWYVWALLAPIVLWTSRRFPFVPGAWLRSVPAHLVAVVVVTLLHVAAMAAIGPWFYDHAPRLSWLHRTHRDWVQFFDWEMATYWAIVAFSHAGAYYREAQVRTLRASQLEARLAEAKLEALQRQLHPHFLFNTLNAISALMHRDVEAADEMLARLSDLLRMALDQRGMQEIPLKDELEFVEKYLEIEQARFGDRFSVSVDVAPDALDALVPNLVLQPLVENSIRHAVSTRLEPTHVEIRAQRIGDMLQLQVCDDGPGLPPAPAKPFRGVGLANTRSRLEQLYGTAQRMEFSRPAAPSGLVVTIEIPFRVQQPEAFSEPVEGVA